MAKLWEVIKAFQEGSADKAERGGRETGRKVKMVRESFGVAYYDDNDKPYDSQAIGNDDLTAEWEIIEKPGKETFARLIIVHQVMSENKETSMVVGTFENTSLHEVQRTIHEFPNDIVMTISAVGINENGRTTILIQEGNSVDA